MGFRSIVCSKWSSSLVFVPLKCCQTVQPLLHYVPSALKEAKEMDQNYKKFTAHLLCFNLYCTDLLFLRGQEHATHPPHKKFWSTALNYPDKADQLFSLPRIYPIAFFSNPLSLAVPSVVPPPPAPISQAGPWDPQIKIPVTYSYFSHPPITHSHFLTIGTYCPLRFPVASERAAWSGRHGTVFRSISERHCRLARGQLNHSLDMKVGTYELGIEDSFQFSTIYSIDILYAVCTMILYILQLVCSIYFSIAI